MKFESAGELMAFIRNNTDQNGWFTTDYIKAEKDEWPIISTQFKELMDKGYIRRMNNHMFRVVQ